MKNAIRRAAASGALPSALLAHQSLAQNQHQHIPIPAADDPMVILLDQIFRGLKDIHEIPFEEVEVINDSGGEQAYGELTVRGIRELKHRMLPNPGGHREVFVDLGSGCGKSVIQVAKEWTLDGVVKAIGIELSKTRHDVGQAGLQRVDDSELRARVQLVQADMLVCPHLEDATLIYVASLLFDDDFMSRLGSRLAALPNVHCVASLRQFPLGSLPGFTEDPSNVQSSLADRVEVTWGAAHVFIYRRPRTREDMNLMATIIK